MADDLAERYGDLLTGSYDCVDRIVLNAYYPLGHSPGGFRVWWRRLHDDSDEELDNAHLMRLAGRFARRVRAFAAASGIPVIDCGRGERKHLIVEEYLRTHSVAPGVFLILVARAPATVRDVRRSADGRVIGTIAKKTSHVNHYSFHIMDPVWGHLTIKMSGHPRSARRSSSTDTSMSRSPPRARRSGLSRRGTVLLVSRIRSAWPGSQTPYRSTRL